MSSDAKLVVVVFSLVLAIHEASAGPCISPFSLAIGTGNTCYYPVPPGTSDPSEYCEGLHHEINPPNRIGYHQIPPSLDICFYVIGFPGTQSFPSGCCGGGLPPGR